MFPYRTNSFRRFNGIPTSSWWEEEKTIYITTIITI